MPGTAHNALTNSSSIASSDNLEESMRHSKIVDENGQKGADGQANPYPGRPGEPDCSFYLRTGLCSYGSKCKYNHPTGQGTLDVDELPQRDGQPDCRFFLKTGTCKFGMTCKYHHPRDKHDGQLVQLNVLGLPIRKDEKSCPHYMKTGSCKFRVYCKFNHPQPANVGTMFPVSGPSVYKYTGSSAPTRAPSLISGLSPLPSSRTPYMTSPHMQGLPAYMPLILPPTQASMPTQQGSSTYMGTISIPSNSVFGPNQMSNSKHYSQPGSSMATNFPERPNQPECQYYMKTGSCKYGTSCKYHHPKERNQVASCTIGPFGLPLRPGRPACTFYATYGSCKYGAACKFDHPFVAMFALPEPSALFSYQRGSEFTWMMSENPSFRSPKAPDELMKSVRIRELQDENDNEHENPSTQTSSNTAPHSESSVNQSN